MALRRTVRCVLLADDAVRLVFFRVYCFGISQRNCEKNKFGRRLEINNVHPTLRTTVRSIINPAVKLISEPVGIRVVVSKPQLYCRQNLRVSEPSSCDMDDGQKPFSSIGSGISI